MQTPATLKSLKSLLAMYACVFALCVSTVTAAPSLPSISTAQLANLVEEQQNRFNRMRVQYRITYGTAADPSVLQTQFSPDQPKYEVKADYGADLAGSKLYIDEDMLTKDQKSFVSRAAFDGKCGTQVSMLAPGQDQWGGTVIAGAPNVFNPVEASHWRPPDATFWPIKGRDLASLIRKSRDIDLTVKSTEGIPTYCVSMLVVQDVVIHLEGQPTVGQMSDIYRIWLAPSFGMLPIREEKYGADQAKDTKAIPRMVRINRSFREVVPGVWFPYEDFEFRYRKDRPVAFRVDVAAVTLGEAAEVPGRVIFPDGTYVTDTIKGIKYNLGMSGRVVDETVLNMTTETKNIQAGRSSITGSSASAPSSFTANGAASHSQFGAGAYVALGLLSLVVSLIGTYCCFRWRKYSVRHV